MSIKVRTWYHRICFIKLYSSQNKKLCFFGRWKSSENGHLRWHMYFLLDNKKKKRKRYDTCTMFHVISILRQEFVLLAKLLFFLFLFHLKLIMLSKQNNQSIFMQSLIATRIILYSCVIIKKKKSCIPVYLQPTLVGVRCFNSYAKLRMFVKVRFFVCS